LNVLFADEIGSRVARRANIDNLDVRVLGEYLIDEVRLQGEVIVHIERCLDHSYIVDLCGDRAHAIGRWTRQDLIDARTAEGAEKGIDCLIAADAYKEVLRSDVLLGVGVSVAKVTEQLLELVLVAESILSIACRA